MGLAGANWNELMGMNSRCVNNAHCDHSKADSSAREVNGVSEATVNGTVARQH